LCRGKSKSKSEKQIPYGDDRKKGKSKSKSKSEIQGSFDSVALGAASLRMTVQNEALGAQDDGAE
jgi:hypothetical protein